MEKVIVDWLLAHSHKTLTPAEWCDLLDAEIIDPDGWRGSNAPDIDAPIGLLEFVKRYSDSTVR